MAFDIYVEERLLGALFRYLLANDAFSPDYFIITMQHCMFQVACIPVLEGVRLGLSERCQLLTSTGLI